MTDEHRTADIEEIKETPRRGRGRPRKDPSVPRPMVVAKPAFRPKKPLVYFVQAAPGWVIKIGITGNLTNRLTDLRVASGFNLNVLGVINEAGRSTERMLHARFSAHRVVGEWFRPVPEILEYIEANASPWEESAVRRNRRRIDHLPDMGDPDSFPYAQSRVGAPRTLTDEETQRIQDEEIWHMDENGYETWRIAIITGLSAEQVVKRVEWKGWLRAFARRGMSLDGLGDGSVNIDVTK